MSSLGKVLVVDGKYCAGKSDAVRGISLSSLGRLFVVAGNICAGKSTVVKELGCGEFIEPSAEDNEWLVRFYSDPKRYGEVMQYYLMQKRFSCLMRAFQRVLKGEDVYLDRAVWDDFVFVWKNFVDGCFSNEAFETYKEMRRMLVEELQFPSAFVYLDVTVTECLRRNREERQNACEGGLTPGYLHGLEKGYEIVMNEALDRGIPWFILDWNKFGTATEIRSVVQYTPRYTHDALWIQKVNDPEWVKKIEVTLDCYFEAAKKKSDDYAQPKEKPPVLPVSSTLLRPSPIKG